MAYSLHKVWETPPIAGKLLMSPVFIESDYSYMIQVFPKEMTKTNSLTVVISMRNPPTESHYVTLNLALLSKRKKEVTQDVVFSKKASACRFDNFLSYDELPSFSRKGKITFDLTISHSALNKPDYRTLTGYVGLENQAATCYMNSVLELLFHIPAFRRIVYSIKTDAPVIVSMQHLFSLLQISPVSVTTKELTKSFGWTQFDSFRQNDVQEFIRVLLDKIEESTKGNTAISDLLRGEIIHSIRCINVDVKSESKEYFYDINLPIKGKPSLEAALADFVADEEMIGDNQYNTEHDGKQDAVMGYKFSMLPPVLQIQLQRFEFTMYGQQKISERVTFPESLDMAPYCLNYSGVTSFDLHSVLVHIGSTFAGHYIAYVKRNKKWFCFNDDAVTVVTFDEVKRSFGGESANGPAAYFLCYVRSDKFAEVMEEVRESEIPCLEYAEKMSEELDPNNLTFRFVNKIERITVPKNSTVSKILSEARKKWPDTTAIWLPNSDNLPSHLVPNKIEVSKIAHTPLYMANFDSPAGSIVFQVNFFMKKAKPQFRDLGFICIGQNEKYSALARKVSQLLKLPNKLVGWQGKNQLQMNDTAVANGAVTFSVEDESTVDPLPTINDVYYAIPDGKNLDSAPLFQDFANRCVKIKVSKLTIWITRSQTFSDLIGAVRNALNLNSEQGVILIIQKIAINILKDKMIGEIIKDDEGEMSYKVVDQTQEKTDTTYTFQYQLMNDNLQDLGKRTVYISEGHTIGDLLSEVRKDNDLDGMNLRLLKMNQSQILSILDDRELVSILNHDDDLRVDIVPDSQIDVPRDNFIRCSFSYNMSYPPSSCFSNPFIFVMEPDETFDVTRCRLQSMLEPSIENFKFKLYNGYTGYLELDDESVLYDLANYHTSTLYLICSPKEMLEMMGHHTDDGVKIYA